MKFFLTSAQTKVLSGLFTDLAAGSLTTLLAAPVGGFWLLTTRLFLGIVFLIVAIKFEEVSRL